MKKYMIVWLMSIYLSCIFSVSAMAEWKQNSIGWWYENSDGSYCQNGWKQVDGQWYFFNEEGYCLTNTLTPDGYWVDENGHFDEQKRIYGKCVFNPTSYVKVGDKFLITGNICDTGYTDQRVIDMLYPGDIVFTPGLTYCGRVCEFNTMQKIDRITYDEGRKTLVTNSSYYDERGNLIKYTFYLNSQSVFGESTESMPWPIYQIIQENVVLIADSNTIFSSDEVVYDDQRTLESCLENWTVVWWPNDDKVWEIDLNGSYIRKAINIHLNYMG